VVILFGTLNLHRIDLINLTTNWLLILTTGVASGHFVNLSMDLDVTSPPGLIGLIAYLYH
jgi:hypothetical protein